MDERHTPEMEVTRTPDLRPDLHQIVREEMRGLRFRTLTTGWHQHAEQVRALENQYGLEIMAAYREYFLTFRQELPHRLDWWDKNQRTARRLDVDTASFVNSMNGQLEHSDTQGRLWFESRIDVARVVESNLATARRQGWTRV